MAKTKKEKQQAALERLTSHMAGLLSSGIAATPSQRHEYNTLKKALGLEGRML